jgi:hypothetical protein
MDPVSPEALFDFFTGNLPDWRHPLAHEGGRAHPSFSACEYAQK